MIPGYKLHFDEETSRKSVNVWQIMGKSVVKPFS